MRTPVDKKSFSLLVFLTPLLLFFNLTRAFSQDAEALMMEPEFTVLFSTDTRWSYSVGLANRGILLNEIAADNYSENVTEHIEVNSWLIYATGERSDISLGIRYRFREMFDSTQENLFRILQQYYTEADNGIVKWWHRARFEQRFGPSLTIFRLRYEFGISKPIANNFLLELSTEALYSMSRQFKPRPEQRVALQLINTSLKRWEFNLGPEYRMDNYIRDQQNNIFIMAGVLLNL